MTLRRSPEDRGGLTLKCRVVQGNNRFRCAFFGKAPACGRQLKIGDAQMNSDIIQGNWTELKGKVQKQWGKLTDDDLDKIEGKRKELVGRVQKRYGYAMDQAEKEVNSFFDDLD